MENRGTLGVVGALALAGVVSLSLQPGTTSGGDNGTAAFRASARAQAQTKASDTNAEEKKRACNDLAQVLELFLAIDKAPRPDSCFPEKSVKPVVEPGVAVNPKYVIATLPDPVHTHLPLMFDRMAEVIQQAAQDENYSYEASWLPWDDKEETYQRLSDEDQADDRKELVEDQPGILVFRHDVSTAAPKTSSQLSSEPSNDPLLPYRDGLIVFVVGEDPTRGIHIHQFTNALAWIDKLKALNGENRARVAILGPTASGSFPSLAKLLSDGPPGTYARDIHGSNTVALPIYSGTANSGDAVRTFGASISQTNLSHLNIDFHVFLERDEVALERYCKFIETQSHKTALIAIISEDETAYGASSEDSGRQKSRVAAKDNNCPREPLRLYYPRDISALRAAYQTNSVFKSTAPQQSSASQRRRLPTDLADPEEQNHDTIRSYAGNQTPLSQEAYLGGLVDTLQAHHIQYVILRSTNALDQLFLAGFLRRAYPDARIVTGNSDRLFERDRASTGMSGAMSLSTYPLIEPGRDWIDGTASSSGQRLFNSDTSEGTYIALRLLLHTPALGKDPSTEGSTDACRLSSNTGQFDPIAYPSSASLPPLPADCNHWLQDEKHLPPIPDYGMPSWMIPTDKCPAGSTDPNCDAFRRPATWLTVLGRDGYKPIAALNGNTITSKVADRGPIGRAGFGMPLILKLFLIFLGIFIAFHAWCCSKASFTAKPSFRTHFVDPGEKRHTVLIFLGGLFASMLPLLVGWGCGTFDGSSAGLSWGWLVLAILVIECLAALLASFANIRRVEQLGSGNGESRVISRWVFGGSVLWIILFFATFVLPFKAELILAMRSFSYYRSMRILSGVSPMVPLLVLTWGMYAWFWHSLHGLALFGADRCRLPSEIALELPDTEMKPVLRMFSQEKAAVETEDGAKPLDLYVLRRVGILAVFGVAFTLSVSRGYLPIHTLGTRVYAIIFFAYLTVIFSLMLAEAWQLLRTWSRLRELLIFLDRTPLRRTLAALRGFSWGSVWGMSGNVLDVRYKLLSRQLECLGHTVAALQAHTDGKASDNARACIAELSCIALLRKIQQGVKIEERDRPDLIQDCLDSLEQLQKSTPESSRTTLNTAHDCIKAQKVETLMADPIAVAVIQQCVFDIERFVNCQIKRAETVEKECVDELEKTRGAGMKFAKWYADKYDCIDAECPKLLETFQKTAAKTAGILLVRLLLPEWRTEKNSLVLVKVKQSKGGDSGDDPKAAPPLSKKKHIRDAEEFVCLPYMGFVQNVLGRIRSMVMTILWLFVVAAIAISSYPFDPRQGLSGVMLALFVLLGAVILHVYAQMHKDATLSHVTNTTPGELGGDFWLKILGVGIAPLLGLLTTVFPGIADFVFSWLQPGLQSFK